MKKYIIAICYILVLSTCASATGTKSTSKNIKITDWNIKEKVVGKKTNITGTITVKNQGSKTISDISYTIEIQDTAGNTISKSKNITLLNWIEKS